MTETFISWNNHYRIPSQRDVYHYNKIPIIGFKNDKYPHLSLQYLQNKFNDYIPSWMAIDQFIPIPQIITELINIILRDLWDKTAKDRKRKIKDIGACYDNCKISIEFINYSYKVIVHKTIESKLKSEPTNKSYKKLLDDEYQIFEIDNTWNDPKYSTLKKMIIDYTKELNELIQFLVSKHPEIMHKYKQIHFKALDMAAFLLYYINQTPILIQNMSWIY